MKSMQPVWLRRKLRDKKKTTKKKTHQRRRSIRELRCTLITSATDDVKTAIDVESLLGDNHAQSLVISATDDVESTVYDESFIDENHDDQASYLPIFDDMVVAAASSIDDDVENDVNSVYLPRSNRALSDELLVLKVEEFERHGWTKFHTSYRGASKTSQQSTAILRNVVKFFLRLHFLRIQSPVGNVDDITTLELFVLLVMDRALQDTMQCLLADYPFSESTLATHLYDVLHALHWLRTLDTVNGVQLPDDFEQRCYALETSLSENARGVKKCVKRALHNADHSIAAGVFNGTYPPGGLAQLRDVALEAAANMVAQFTDKDPVLTELLYKKFMETLFSVMYVTSPQGRIGGIMALQLLHLREFNINGYCFSRFFKTSKSLYVQPIILSAVTRSLLKIYIEQVRVLVVPPNAKLRPEDPLWLTFTGVPFTNIGRLVSAFYRDTIAVKVTTTLIRGMVETEAAARLSAGEITAAARSSISVIVGHGDKTAKDFYVRTNAAADVALAREAFGMEALPDLDMEADQQLEVEEWGTDHPDQKSAGRARWTPEETEYLQALADELLEENSRLYADRLMSTCLRRIRADNSGYTRKIFHARHVYDSSRLRGGYRPKKSVRSVFV